MGIRILILACFACLLFTEAAAQASEGEAEALFRAGREAMKRGQISVARNLFKNSIKLKRTAGAQLNLARCEEELHNLPHALAIYGELQKELPNHDPRLSILRNRMKLLETRVARVTLLVDPTSPPGTFATYGNGKFPVNESRALMPGEHRVTVSAPGHHPEEYVLHLDAAEARTVIIAAGPPLKPSAMEPNLKSRETAHATVRPRPATELSKQLHSAPNGAAPEGRSNSVNPLAYGVLGFGGASLLLSGIAGFLVLEQHAIVERECTTSAGAEPPTCPRRGIIAADRGRLYSNIATVGFVVGIAGVAGGSYTVLVHGTGDRAQMALGASVVTLTGPF